jgi:glycosyltransferase involved in cell wall biosynthesis
MCGYFSDKSNRDAALWFIRSVWPLLAKRHPSLTCQFVGRGIGNEMKQAAFKHPAIELISEVDDLRPYRKQATVFINPMRLGSGLRIKILEAMATGLPVVTTSLGAAGLPAQNGINCFINDTPEGFADSISWLLSDTSLAARIGQTAQQLVATQYSAKTTILELERILKDTITVQHQQVSS